MRLDNPKGTKLFHVVTSIFHKYIISQEAWFLYDAAGFLLVVCIMIIDGQILRTDTKEGIDRGGNRPYRICGLKPLQPVPLRVSYLIVAPTLGGEWQREQRDATYPRTYFYPHRDGRQILCACALSLIEMSYLLSQPNT
jgi:hypothetical protein